MLQALGNEMTVNFGMRKMHYLFWRAKAHSLWKEDGDVLRLDQLPQTYAMY